VSAEDVEVLLEAAASDSARIPEFLTALLEAQVLVAGVLDSDSGLVAAAGSTAGLAPLERADGASVQPFFTSEARLHETLQAVPGYESRYLVLRCRELWEMTRGSTLILNPHSAYGKEFLPGEIAQLLDGTATMTPRVVAAATNVLVGRPAHTPSGMEKALRDLFSAHGTVESAFLGWKVVADSGDQSYLLVVIGSSDELGRALVYFSQVHPVDVTFNRPGDKHLLTEIEPFYVRRKRSRSLFRR
jgi:SseB protein N-terminal domain/SseB protein C-terminal domain